ncbi:MAG: hypothetical protein WCK27_23020 [Verrucomicrobiota bacterium]
MKRFILSHFRVSRASETGRHELSSSWPGRTEKIQRPEDYLPSWQNIGRIGLQLGTVNEKSSDFRRKSRKKEWRERRGSNP